MRLSNKNQDLYLVVSRYSSAFGNVQRMITKGYYNHAGIALDKSLNPMYTYNRKVNGYGGFYIENFHTMSSGVSYDEIEIKVLKCRLNDVQFKNLTNRIKDLSKDSNSARYNFPYLLYSAFGIPISDTKVIESDHNICSVFAGTMARVSGQPVTNKPLNLIQPDDVANADKYNKNYEVVFQGTVDDYYKKEFNNHYTDMVQESINSRSDIQSEFLEKGDGCYNLDKLDPNGSNILYITGISGGGKTTLGKDLTKELNCYRVELDYIEFFYLSRTKFRNEHDKFRKRVNDECPVATKFFDKYPSDYYKYPKTFHDGVCIVKDFLDWFIPLVHGDGNIYIINGTHLYLIYDVSYFYDKPFILKEASWLKGVLRRSYREIDYDDSFINNVNKFAIAFKQGCEKWYINEVKTTNKFRRDMNKNALLVESANNSNTSDIEYGIPELKKYPLDSKKHVLSTIKLFNWVDEKYEKELATNIKRKIKEFNIDDSEIHITDKNKFYKYYKQSKRR